MTNGTQSGTADGTGAYDAGGKRLQMTFSVPFGNAGKTMKLDLLTDSSSGLVTYMRFPLLDLFLPKGKSWVKIDVAKAASARGVDLGQLVQATQSNPAEVIAALVHSSSSEKVGTEQVGGVDTTHYHVLLDAKQTLEGKLSPALRAKIEALLAKEKIDTVPVDVWVDGQDLVRRLELEFPRLQTSAGDKAKGPVRFVEDLSGYGDPVTVDLPPAAQVTDASNGKLGG
jgi:hypothetical protein